MNSNTMNLAQYIGLLIAILGGVIWQRVEIHQLGARIDQLGVRIDQLSARVDRISDDLREFYRELGRHDKAIEVLERNK